MEKRYSPISDLYGVAPLGDTPRYRRRVWLFVLLALVSAFVYESISPVMRLRPDPPADLVGAMLYSKNTEYQAQQRMAQACWDYARLSLQKKYPFGAPLPKVPPVQLSGHTRRAPAIQLLCWQELRHVWTRHDVWAQSYEWNFEWVEKAWDFLETSFKDNVLAQFIFGGS